MKKLITLVSAMICVLGLVSCNLKEKPQQELQQEDINVQYFFTAKVIEVNEEYLRLEVFDIGNTNLSSGATVEVSTDVVAAIGCPAFVIDECARVLLAWNTDCSSSERLEALAIYKADETGQVISD